MIKVKILDNMMAISFLSKPYMNQKTTPVVKRANIKIDIDAVSSVFHILYTCGTNEMVVKIAAAKPK